MPRMGLDDKDPNGGSKVRPGLVAEVPAGQEARAGTKRESWTANDGSLDVDPARSTCQQH